MQPPMAPVTAWGPAELAATGPAAAPERQPTALAGAGARAGTAARLSAQTPAAKIGLAFMRLPLRVERAGGARTGFRWGPAPAQGPRGTDGRRPQPTKFSFPAHNSD